MMRVSFIKTVFNVFGVYILCRCVYCFTLFMLYSQSFYERGGSLGTSRHSQWRSHFCRRRRSSFLFYAWLVRKSGGSSWLHLGYIWDWKERFFLGRYPTVGLTSQREGTFWTSSYLWKLCHLMNDETLWKSIGSWKFIVETVRERHDKKAGRCMYDAKPQGRPAKIQIWPVT